MNPLLRRASRSSVFIFDFFHSRLGSGRGGDIGGAAPAAAPAASSRLLFFPAVFALLDGDGFILQVHGVFMRIRSGATLAALGGGALRSTGVRRSIRNGYSSDGWKTLRVLVSIYKPKRPSNGQVDKSALG
jgi:hypothetical protein